MKAHFMLRVDETMQNPSAAIEYRDTLENEGFRLETLDISARKTKGRQSHLLGELTASPTDVAGGGSGRSAKTCTTQVASSKATVIQRRPIDWRNVRCQYSQDIGKDYVSHMGSLNLDVRF
jgi:hypothetical protein